MGGPFDLSMSRVSQYLHDIPTSTVKRTSYGAVPPAKQQPICNARQLFLPPSLSAEPNYYQSISHDKDCSAKGSTHQAVAGRCSTVGPKLAVDRSTHAPLPILSVLDDLTPGHAISLRPSEEQKRHIHVPRSSCLYIGRTQREAVAMLFVQEGATVRETSLLTLTVPDARFPGH